MEWVDMDRFSVDVMPTRMGLATLNAPRAYTFNRKSNQTMFAYLLKLIHIQ